MNDEPRPRTELPEIDGQTPIPHQAAMFGVVTPPLAVGLGLVASFLTRGHLAMLVVSAANILLLSIGLICATIALMGIRTYGTDRLLQRGLGGLILNGMFLLYIVVGIVRISTGETPHP